MKEISSIDGFERICKSAGKYIQTNALTYIYAHITLVLSNMILIIDIPLSFQFPYHYSLSFNMNLPFMH